MIHNAPPYTFAEIIRKNQYQHLGTSRQVKKL